MSSGYFSEDTIAAVATSLSGDGGVGIIRISGSKAVEVAGFLSQKKVNLKPRYLHQIRISDPVSKELLDEGLVVFFPKGKSFTGEDVIELQLHGGRFLLQSVLRAALSTGLCRMALAGEFSFRAVKNGKMNLASAESIAQVIAAKSQFEIQSARQNLGEQRNRDVKSLADMLQNLLAQSELSIDFIDQDVEVISAKQLRAELEEGLLKLEGLLSQMRLAQRVARGLQVTLIGAPNAGKSTLFNALLAEERAIVSPEAGTTRDVITEEITVGRYFVRLADTAGVRDGKNAIESEGIERAKGLGRDSDVSLIVIDVADKEISEIVRETNDRLEQSGESAIVVFNKTDCASPKNVASAASLLRMVVSSPIVQVSAFSGEGIAALLSTLEKALDSKVGMEKLPYLPTEFQLQMATRCRDALKQVFDLVSSQGLEHPELVSAGLNGALRALSDLVGETTPDTVLAKIFSEFCIGK